MRKQIIILTISCILLSSQIYGQKISQVTFINEIADKEQVTYGEGIQFFLMVIEKKIGSFQENVNFLNKEGLTKGITLTKDSPLRRGTLSLILARHLKLSDSLLYNIFKSERYAYRACAAKEIMEYDGSEWEILSGGELVEIMTKVSEMLGGN